MNYFTVRLYVAKPNSLRGVGKLNGVDAASTMYMASSGQGASYDLDTLASSRATAMKNIMDIKLNFHGLSKKVSDFNLIEMGVDDEGIATPIIERHTKWESYSSPERYLRPGEEMPEGYIVWTKKLYQGELVQRQLDNYPKNEASLSDWQADVLAVYRKARGGE